MDKAFKAPKIAVPKRVKVESTAEDGREVAKADEPAYTPAQMQQLSTLAANAQETMMQLATVSVTLSADL